MFQKTKKTEFMKETEGLVGGFFLLFWSWVGIMGLSYLLIPVAVIADLLLAFIETAYPGAMGQSMTSFYEGYGGLVDLVAGLLIFGSVVALFSGVFAVIGKLLAIAVVTGPVWGARYFWAYTGIRPLVSYPLGFISVLVFYHLYFAFVVAFQTGDVAGAVDWFTSCYVNLWNGIVYGLTNLWNAIVGGN